MEGWDPVWDGQEMPVWGCSDSSTEELVWIHWAGSQWGWTEKIVSNWSCGKDYIPNQEFSLRSETKGLVRVLGFCEQTYIKGVKGDQIAVSLQQGKLY